ncbi:MAG: DUF4142 domain-containing protein [Burkholderiales bacterium]|nr:DUF4142 domain-containing protein [Burkholderiales bacterium]
MMTVSKTAMLALLAALSVGARAQQQAAPTDAQIAAIVVTANQVDIDAGKLAIGRAHAKDVKEFARLMVEDHTNVNKAAVALAHKLNLTPEDNATSRSLKQGGDDNLAKLRTLKGEDFDTAYIDHEVAYHEAVLDAIDKTLIPDAQSSALKALLRQARPTFVAHLAHARLIQRELGKSGE